MDSQDLNELTAWTLTHGGAEFIHQYVVDAWAAQHVDEQSKPIGVAFALIGLYLHLERGFTGRERSLVLFGVGVVEAQSRPVARVGCGRGLG